MHSYNTFWLLHNPTSHLPPPPPSSRLFTSCSRRLLPPYKSLSHFHKCLVLACSPIHSHGDFNWSPLCDFGFGTIWKHSVGSLADTDLGPTGSLVLVLGLSFLVSSSCQLGKASDEESLDLTGLWAFWLIDVGRSSPPCRIFLRHGSWLRIHTEPAHSVSHGS